MTKNQLEITHLASGAKFKFKRKGLTLFSESYSSNWNPEKVFGKMDPILSYSNTERKISFSISVTGRGDKKQAESLARVLYPTYTNTNALSLKEPPLIRILFGDLIKAGDNLGLLCAVESLEVDRGERYFLSSQADQSSLTSGKILLQFNVIPLHEYDLGWFEVTDEKGLNVIKKINPTVRIDANTKVYHFGSSDPKEVTFSNRKINQVFTKSNPFGIKAKK